METAPSSSRERLLPRRAAFAAGLVMLATAVMLRLIGRQFVSDSGFGVWAGAWTRNTSQWFADPYSITHVLHGIFLYWLLLPLGRWFLPATRLVAAVILESSWEVLENSPFIIERYRANTASLEYYGDSILNSTSDIFCAIVGFWAAWRFGWKWMIALIVAIELLMLYFVRDNLTLNILMLVYPSEAIKHWQTGC